METAQSGALRLEDLKSACFFWQGTRYLEFSNIAAIFREMIHPNVVSLFFFLSKHRHLFL